MRITGGKARGIPIQSGNSKLVRPATDRSREAVFSSLGDLVINANCLDLFAGTGSYGLEALSRGAASCSFVEKDPRSIAAIQTNIKALCKSLQVPALAVKVIKADVLKSVHGLTFDLIFVDPPYEKWSGLTSELEPLLDNWLLEESHARLICESPGAQSLHFQNFQLLKTIGGKKDHDPAIRIFARG